MKKPIKKLIAICIVALLFMTSVLPVSAADGPDTELSSDVSDVMDTQNETDSIPSSETDGTASELPANAESGQGEDAEEPDDQTDAELTLDGETDVVLGTKNLAADWPLLTGTHDKYMDGMEDGKFWPEKYMTRAQFAQVIYNLLKNKPASKSNIFSDVKDDSQWYAKAVNALGNAGIMTGEGGKFKPNSYITRAQALTTFARFFDAVSGDVTFPDVTKNHWAYKAIVTAYKKGWIEGDSNGKIRPEGSLKRAELVKIANRVLGRTDSSDYAKDRDNKDMYFPDVPKGYWGFLDIIEAAKPGVKKPEPPPVSENAYYKVTAVNGLNLRSGPGTTYSSLMALPLNSVVKAVDTTSSAPWYKVTYGSTTGYVHSDYVVLTTEPETPSNGDGVISATSANLAQYKTLYLTASVNGSSSGLTWQSDNTAVAMIVKTKVADSGKSFVYGKSSGTANIIVRNSAGQEVARCKVTVGAPEALRFITSEPNTPSTGQAFDLIAVTDSGKTAVKFVITGPQEATYETTSYKDEKQSSSVNPDLPENVARNFTKSVTLTKAGSYTVRAYSKTASGSWSTSYKEKKLLVVSTQSDTDVSAEKRATSSKMIDIIAQFEGRRNDVYLDTLASNIPTVGCGYVVYKNGTFYNNLTTTEMNAMLGETINSDGYETAVENFRSNNGIKMSQAQFDALVSFSYNLGTGYLNTGYDTFKVLLSATSKKSGTGKVYAGDAILYSEANASKKTDKKLSNGTDVTVTEIKRVDGKVDNLWYKITYSGGGGWVRGGRVKMNDAGTVDLAYIDEQTFGSNILLFNIAGNVHVPGLVTRRLAEAKIFCYGAYSEAYHSSKTYTTNVGFDVPSAFTYTESDGVGKWVAN